MKTNSVLINIRHQSPIKYKNQSQIGEQFKIKTFKEVLISFFKYLCKYFPLTKFKSCSD
jgi:hypothetical protein